MAEMGKTLKAIKKQIAMELEELLKTNPTDHKIAEFVALANQRERRAVQVDADMAKLKARLRKKYKPRKRK